MEDGIRDLELIVEVSDEISGEEEAESGFGEKAQRRGMRVEKIGLQRGPVFFCSKGADFRTGLAALEAALQKMLTREFHVLKGGADLLNDRLLIAHVSLFNARAPVVSLRGCR